MSKYYTLKNKIIGDKAAVFFDERIQKFVESNFPTGQAQPSEKSSFTPIGGRELANMLNKYYKVKSEAMVRKAHGSADFLPFSFLSRGVRCGLSVCLLFRQYSDVSVQELISTIESNTNEYTTKELSNLLKISDHDTFWGKYVLVSEAFKNVNGIKERLKTHIKGEPLPVGTGFLVGKDYILTNNHVLPSKDNADEFIVRFRYEVDFYGREATFIDYRLDPGFFYTSDNELDYTLAKVSSLSEQEKRVKGLSFLEAGNNFGWLQMTEKEDDAVAIPPIPTLKKVNMGALFVEELKKAISHTFDPVESTLEFSTILGASPWARSLIDKDTDFQKGLNKEVKESLEIKGLKGQPVSIVQHPKGKRKEVVLYGNRMQAIYKNLIQYETDAEPGSSGSPLFNDQWQLIGIHHSALVNAEEGEIIGYLGTRICRIVQDLKKKTEISDYEDLKRFLNDYVYEVKRGKIFISAGRHRNLVGLESKAKFESEIMYKLGSKVVEKIHAASSARRYGLDAVHIQQNMPETAESLDLTIDWLQRDKNAYQPGDIAIEILLDADSKLNDSLDEQSVETVIPENARGAKAYYLRNLTERKLNAELLLSEFLKSAQTVDKKVNGEQSDFPNLGAQSDKKLEKFKFCSNVSMPSLILYAGYMTSEQDCNLFQKDEHLDQLADGIAEGLVQWANALSPTIL
jgi:V8-like Glu-specific endopeptidase